MGNRKLEHYRSWVHTTPPIMLETIIIETWKQHFRIGVIQSFYACITSTRVETIVAPNIDVVKRRVLIGSTTKLGSKSSGVSLVKNLNRSSAPLIVVTRVVGILQIMFTKPIMTTHVNMIVD